MKSEQSARSVSDFRCMSWENCSTSGFFHHYLVNCQTLGVIVLFHCSLLLRCVHLQTRNA